MGRPFPSGILFKLSRHEILGRFDANTYLRLLRALDLYDPALGYENEETALKRIKANYTFVAVTSDQLFKQVDVYKSKQKLEQAGVNLEFHEFHSDFGHDAFWLIMTF